MLVASGHDVTAVVRNPQALTADVRKVTADLASPDPAVLRSAVTDAVLSGLGPRGRRHQRRGHSALDWTAVGVPLLTDKPPTGTYRTAHGQSVRGGHRITRADAAHFMLRAIEQPETIGKSIAIAN
jgi:putative NADH-flavin reductase